MEYFFQKSLFTAVDEARQYHQSRARGFFAVLYDTGQHDARGRRIRRQRSYRLDQLAWVVDHVDSSRDTWISQAEFLVPNRRVVNLARIGLCFVDIDYYHCDDLHLLPPERVASRLLYYCAGEGLPAPNIIISSGQGLQLKWILDRSLPRAALPRWNAVQRVLVAALNAFGSDPKAKDASRVLRLVGTVNSKSGEVAHVVHADGGTYPFEYLAELVLPLTRNETDAAQCTRPRLGRMQGGGQAAKSAFSNRTLAWHRLEDLRTLATLRGGYRKGERMEHLFWQMNFLLLSGATNSVQMGREARELARLIDPTWRWRDDELGTLYRKAQAAAAGERVKFNGRYYPPLYTPRNQTLIDLFGITEEEQRQLRTIISVEIARERHRNRERKRRRAAKAVTRGEYIKSAAERANRALALRQNGHRWAQVGEILGTSAESARALVKRLKSTS